MLSEEKTDKSKSIFSRLGETLTRKTRHIAACIALSAFSLSAHADGQIEIVGSSTVYPFSTVVAERFAQITGRPAPKVESTGTGGGMKLFCSGVGEGTPDISNASRRIKQSELDNCNASGVSGVVEVKIGYDGIVVAQSVDGEAFPLTQEILFRALARDVPAAAEGETMPNATKTWKDVDPSLPDIAIKVYGPPPTSGTRDAFVELAMESGCRQTAPWVSGFKKTDKKSYKAMCHAIREDGAYVEAGENDNLIIQKLGADPQAFGVFGFSFLDENSDKVRGLSIDGREPTFEAIADSSYPISRPLFFYAKSEHFDRTEGLREFVEFFSADQAIGPDGFLVDRGLIPLPEIDRGELRTGLANGEVLTDLTN